MPAPSARIRHSDSAELRSCTTRLTASFMACPRPASPTRMTRAAKADSTAGRRLDVLRSPGGHDEQLARRHRRHAARDRRVHETPSRGGVGARERLAATPTPLVPRSHTTAPGARASRRSGSSSTAVVASPSASMLSTTSAPRARRRRASWTMTRSALADVLAHGEGAGGVRFHSRTRCPAATRRWHIAAPIRPAPSTATSATRVHQDLPGDLAGGQAAAARGRRRPRAAPPDRPCRAPRSRRVRTSRAAGRSSPHTCATVVRTSTSRRTTGARLERGRRAVQSHEHDRAAACSEGERPLHRARDPGGLEDDVGAVRAPGRRTSSGPAVGLTSAVSVAPSARAASSRPASTSTASTGPSCPSSPAHTKDPIAPAPSSTTESPGRTPERRTAWMPTASGWASAADSRRAAPRGSRRRWPPVRAT